MKKKIQNASHIPNKKVLHSSLVLCSFIIMFSLYNKLGLNACICMF